MFPKRSVVDRETFWRENLSAAKQAYDQSTIRANMIQEEQKYFPLPWADSALSVRKALQEEGAARAEYLRVLEIFKDLVVHGEPGEVIMDAEE
jgi:hypothetical protein